MVAILGIVAAIGATNLIKSRDTAQKNTCIANLRQIDSAMQQWVLENKKGGTDTYSLTDGSLLPFIKGSRLPVCPGGGTYNAGATVMILPTCTLSTIGHSL